ncbi:MAG: TFIIB-type zinc ribbon-containing protein [Promethearchaeota archaeon]
MSRDSEICPECNGKLILNSSENICKNCGLIVENIFIEIKNKETILPKDIIETIKEILIYLNLNKNIGYYTLYYYKKIIDFNREIFNNVPLVAYCLFYSIRKNYHNIAITINDIVMAFQNFGYTLDPLVIIKEGSRYNHYLDIKLSSFDYEVNLKKLVNKVTKHPKISKRLALTGVNWSKREFQKRLLMKSLRILKEIPFSEKCKGNPFILTGAIIYLADELLAQEHKRRSILTQKIISDATYIARYSLSVYYLNILKPIFFVS